jgi:hypothetical protein
MTVMLWLYSGLLLSCLLSTVSSYDMVRDYSGRNFFNGWDFYGDYDNLTLGEIINYPSQTINVYAMSNR